MAYVVARLFDWRALFGNYMSRHQKKPHRPYPAPQEQQQQGRPENGQPPAPKPFNMRRVVAISFALAVAIVLLSYGVNRREQAAMQSVEPPMASDTGVIPDSEAQAEERARKGYDRACGRCLCGRCGERTGRFGCGFGCFGGFGLVICKPFFVFLTFFLNLYLNLFQAA